MGPVEVENAGRSDVRPYRGAPHLLHAVLDGRWIDRSGAGGLAAGALILIAVGSCLAVAATAPLFELSYPVAAALTAGILCRRRPDALLEFVLWMWLVTPGVRRVVDLAGGWTPVSPVMLAPPLATLVVVPLVLRRRAALPRREARPLWLVTGVLAYGAALGAARNGVAASLADLLLWLPPVALALYILLFNADRVQFATVLSRVAMLSSLLLGTYALIQYIAPPPWDVYWMQSAPLSSIGRPEPYEVRVFSTLNSPGPFGSVTAVLLLVTATSERLRGGWLRGAALLAGIAGLGLSSARTGWLVLLVGVAVLLLLGSRRSRSATLKVAGGVALLLLIAGPLATDFEERISETRAISTDDSFIARSSLYRSFGPHVLRDPAGAGLGATGVATKVANSGEPGRLGSLDSGLLDALYTFGAVGGILYLSIVGWQAATLIRLSWRRRRFTLPAAVIVALALQLWSGALIGILGLLFWMVWAIALSRSHFEGATP